MFRPPIEMHIDRAYIYDTSSTYLELIHNRDDLFLQSFIGHFPSPKVDLVAN